MLTGSNPAEIDHVKQHLHKCFGIKDLGPLQYFLGLEVSYLLQDIVLSQKKFTLELLKDNHLSLSKPTITPLPPHSKLSPDEGDILQDRTYYRTMVGKLNFLTHTQPKLCFTAQTLS